MPRVAEPMIPRVTLAAVGDVMLGRGVAAVARKRGGWRWVFERARPLVSKADIAFCNLECALTRRKVHVAKKIVLKADPSAVWGLKWCGFNVASLANNHTLDFGRKGLLDTIRALKRAGIAPCGAGRNLEEALSPVIVERKGLRVAFLCFCDFPPPLVFDPEKPCVAPARPDLIRRAVREAKGKADIVVCSFHWGIEYAGWRSGRQRELAVCAIEAGARLVLGHHPHVLQPLLRYKGVYIAYSLGNFVFDQRRQETRRTAVLWCELTKGRVASARLIPFRIENFRPVPASG